MALPGVSVLTPTVPERAEMLAECRDSVALQYDVVEHHVYLDEGFQGCARAMNLLASEAVGKWILPLADDDLLLYGCVSQHLLASDGADVVYGPPEVEGESEAPFHGEPPGIPSLALISTNLWRYLGGYDESLEHCEDLDFFRRAMEVGAVFRRIPEKTWVYRIDNGIGNKSRGHVFT